MIGSLLLVPRCTTTLYQASAIAVVAIVFCTLAEDQSTLLAKLFILLPFAFSHTIRPPSQQQPIKGQHYQLQNFIDGSIFAKVNLNLEDQQGLAPSTQNEFKLLGSGAFDDDLSFAGIVTFAHLDWKNRFTSASENTFDIGIVGAPFDLGVTYRSGQRFGPVGARLGSRRLASSMGYSMDYKTNPFLDWATVVDCGDIVNSPFDKLQAIHDLEQGWKTIGSQKPRKPEQGDHVRLVSIGGDHTISLPALRALHSIWNREIAILHFDSHLDTWDPKQLNGGLTKYSEVTHGTMLHLAHNEGLISNHSNMHVGSRSTLFEKDYDLENDAHCGFSYIRAREIDEMGIDAIVQRVVERVGGKLVYLSVDIDVLDPAFAPATGTIEPGGWSTRELLQIIHKLSEANVTLVGADVVEFSPVYDNMAETTAIAVSQIVYEIVQWMVNVPVRRV